MRRDRQSLSGQLLGEEGQLGGQASQKGEKFKVGDKLMLIFCLECLPMPEPTAGNTDSFTRQLVHGFLLTSSAELNPPSSYNAVPLNGANKVIIALYFSKEL